MINELNLKIFNLINSFAGKNNFLDSFFIFIGKYLIFLFIIIVFWLLFTKYKKISIYSIYAGILGILVNFIIRLIYPHNRPFADNIGTLLIPHQATPSFPSNHVSFALSISITMFYFKETKVLGIILFALGLFIGFSRIFCGVHYPFDIFGSIVVGIICSYFIYKIKPKEGF